MVLTMPKEVPILTCACPRNFALRRSDERNDSILFNLKLDINALKQEISDLAVCRSLLLEGRCKPKRISKVRRNTKLLSLRTAVRDLKRELRELYVKRALLLSMRSEGIFAHEGDPSASILQTVRRYFGGFRDGYNSNNSTHAAFVHSIADPTLTLGITGLGVEMLLEQWRRYTSYFAITEFYVKSMACIQVNSSLPHDGRVVRKVEALPPTTIIRSLLYFRGVFTLRGISEVFPSVLGDPQMLSQLLCREMRCPLLIHTYFNASGKMVRHDVETDFFGAIAEALGDTVVAARVMASAVVAEESMVGVAPTAACSDERQAELPENDAIIGESSELPIPSPASDRGGRQSILYLLS